MALFKQDFKNTTTKILAAKITDSSADLNKISERINIINRGRTDDIVFDMYDNIVTVSHAYFNLSIERQKEQLEWFLNDTTYEYETD